MVNRLKGKRAIITGATAGIGEETAIQLASAGVNLILTGRRKERLNKLRDKLIAEFPQCEIHISDFDVRDREACKAFYEAHKHLAVDILINNAGLASGVDKVQTADLDDWDIMIDTNIKGLITITRMFLPDMVERNQGHIINVGSIAGRETYPGGSVYCATKHAVHAFSRALKMDVGHTNIRVGIVSPGAVDTEFGVTRFKGDMQKADQVYAGIHPLYANDIAEIIVFMLNRPDHVNIIESFVTPVAQSAATQVFRKL
jgi:3-hydroxy acid dehydrogenase / malonic semialdehyde reductase